MRGINHHERMAAKGMIEGEGKAIFVRIENDDLLLVKDRHAQRLHHHSASGHRRLQRNVRQTTGCIAVRGQPAGHQSIEAPPRRKGFLFEKLPVGAKTIQLMLKENSLGRFVRLVEGDGFRFTTIMIPANNSKSSGPCWMRPFAFPVKRHGRFIWLRKPSILSWI